MLKHVRIKSVTSWIVFSYRIERVKVVIWYVVRFWTCLDYFVRFKTLSIFGHTSAAWEYEGKFNWPLIKNTVGLIICTNGVMIYCIRQSNISMTSFVFLDG